MADDGAGKSSIEKYNNLQTALYTLCIAKSKLGLAYAVLSIPSRII